jgi:hypothetical protein
MLDKARSLYETLKANWIVGANKDQFQLALYLSVQNEYDSGSAKEGLLAKISAESNYDEKLTKANYVKVRVSELMSKRNEIATLMDLIQNKQEAIDNTPCEVDETVTETDFIAVERYIAQEIAGATKEINDRFNTKQSIALLGFFMCVLLFLFAFVSFQTNSSSGPYITIALIILIILSFAILVGTKDLDKEANKISLEIENKFNDEIKRSKAAEIAKIRVERAHRQLQEKLSELQRLQRELQKLIS